MKDARELRTPFDASTLVELAGTTGKEAVRLNQPSCGSGKAKLAVLGRPMAPPKELIFKTARRNPPND